MKSLYTGWRRLRWRDIEITGGGAPRVNLSGSALARAELLEVEKVLITITHTDDSAMVFAMSLGAGPPEGLPPPRLPGGLAPAT